MFKAFGPKEKIPGKQGLTLSPRLESHGATSAQCNLCPRLSLGNKNKTPSQKKKKFKDPAKETSWREKISQEEQTQVVSRVPSEVPAIHEVPPCWPDWSHTPDLKSSTYLSLLKCWDSSGRPFPTELGLPGFGCACCETLSPQRFQLLFFLWEWDQPNPTKRAPSPVHSTPAKRVALVTHVALLPGICQFVGNKNSSEIAASTHSLRAFTGSYNPELMLRGHLGSLSAR
ncbi:hypothetical protein AAY473_006759 [Plecturocebus cupreus]